MSTPTTRYIVQALADEGIDHVFLVPGGLIDPFLEALSQTPGITPVVAAQEGGAAFMADGYARASGRFGSCFGIGGPGVTNMVTAMASATSDFSPVFLLSGQVPTSWEGRGGFQDSSPCALNDVQILAPVTKTSMAVESVHLVHHHLRACLTRMLAGAPGPVHMSLPKDIQQAAPLHPWAPLGEAAYHPRVVDLKALDQLWDILAPRDGSRPPTRVALYAGAGIEHSDAADALARLAEAYALPVATTQRAKGVFPEDHPLSLGVFGYAGHRPAIETLLSGEVEVLIVLGSGLSQRDTMFWNKKMLPTRALIHVDIDPAVIGRTWDTEVPLPGDCRAVIEALLAETGDRARILAEGNLARQSWMERIRALGPVHYDQETTTCGDSPIHPARVVGELRRALPRNGALVSDSGAHRAFCCHHWQAFEPRTYFSATNLGPMGWAIPAGVGVKAALPDRPVAVVTGDGCMLMHGIEMQAAARYGLPVLFVVINNSALANVWLRAHTQGPGPAELTRLPRHDWAGFARSLGLDGITVEHPDELAPAFSRALESGRACCVDVVCDHTCATPVTPYSQAKMDWVDDE